MRICLLAPRQPASDDPIAVHARLLRDAGHEVTLAFTETSVERAEGLMALDDALGHDVDAAVATSWEAAIRLFEMPAKRFVYYVDELAHERLGAWQAERIAAAVTYDLPVDFLAATEWLEGVLREQRPDARVLLARPGVAPADESGRAAGPLRAVAVDEESRAAAEEAEIELVDSLAQADVYVALGGGSPLPGMAAGCVPVVVPGGGRDDLVRHLENGVVATPEDDRGAARWLARLSVDSELRERLRDGVRKSIAGWPSWKEAGKEMESALKEIVKHDPPAVDRWPVRLMADLMAGVAVYRNDHFVLAGELRRLEQDKAYQAAQRLRERWQSPGMAPLRRAAKPLARAAKKRLDE